MHFIKCLDEVSGEGTYSLMRIVCPLELREINSIRLVGQYGDPLFAIYTSLTRHRIYLPFKVNLRCLFDSSLLTLRMNPGSEG